MKLSELKKKVVDQAIDHANECGDESPEEIEVSLQIDGPGANCSVFSNDSVELHYDNNLNASGCVLTACKQA